MLLPGQGGEGAAAADQFAPGAVLHHRALLHHQDAIGLAQVAEPVGHEQQGAAADVLAQLIHQPALARQFGEAARRKVLQEFAVSLVNERTVDTYRRLLPLAG